MNSEASTAISPNVRVMVMDRISAGSPPSTSNSLGVYSDCGVSRHRWSRCQTPGAGLRYPEELSVGDAREVRVVLRRESDERGRLVQLIPGHPLHDQLVPAELLGDRDDREVVRDLEVVEARAAVLAEALVASEPGCQSRLQRV